jgi:hypothetical protein
VLWSSDIEFMFVLYCVALILSIRLMNVQSPNLCVGLVKKTMQCIESSRHTLGHVGMRFERDFGLE